MVVELPYGSSDWLVREVLKGVGDLVVLEPADVRGGGAQGGRHELLISADAPISDSPPGHPEIERIVAPNPGPMTLEGTNTYVVGRARRGLRDRPRARRIAGHVEAVRAAADRTAGSRAIVLTHSHADHSAAVPLLDAARCVEV